MKMSISRAMKEKARMVKELNELASTFCYNTYTERSKPLVNVKENYRKVVSLHNNVATIKKMIARANIESGASDIIAEMVECKDLLASLKRIPTDTDSSFSRNPVNGEMEEVKKFAFISNEEVEKEKAKYQERIYALQDKLDELNATTFIDFSPYQD